MKKHSLASNIILFIVILGVLISILTISASAITLEETQVGYEVKFYPLKLTDTEDLDELNDLVLYCKIQMSNAHQMAEYARMLGYPENHVVIRMAQYNWWSYKHVQDEYLNRIKEINSRPITPTYVTQAQINQYPVASTVWKMLKEAGYNDYVCAGILGNMMAECGGQTLDLNPYDYSSSGYYYGLCQWNRDVYGYIFGEDVEYQVNALLDTIKYEIDTYGFKYYSGFNYNTFLNMTDEQDAALAFAMCYERCGSSYYYIREVNATEAYDYFVN